MVKVTADDIAQLLASAPPRLVPDHVAAAAVGGGRTNWITPLLGLVLGGLGLLFVAVFFPWRFWDDWRLAAGSVSLTPGVITAVSKTNLSINKTKVVAYAFRYTPEDGRPRQDRCYTTGERWSRGMSVTVRYLAAEPDVACVEGARLSEGGAIGFVVTVFPLIGGGMIAWFVLNRRRTRRLLHAGQVAEVDVLAVDETSARVNNQTVYRIVLSSPAQPGGPPVTVKRVNRPDVALARKRREEKQPVFVLYDPRAPARLLFPEALIDG